MSTQHTSGPWYVRDINPGKATFNIGASAGGSYHDEIAVVFRTNNLPVHEANARLIAAAPELLTLAKQYASECARCGGSGLIAIHFPGNEGVPAWDADDQPCDECEDIRKVIDKAEGRS